MQIIRDNDLMGLAMIPLFVDWNIRRCNVAGCTNPPTTILTDLGDGIPTVGICEDHYQQGNQGSAITFKFVWNKFDALSPKVERRTEPIPKDPSGQHDSFAKVYGVEFHAFPYQVYSARLGNTRAEVSRYSWLDKDLKPCWFCNIYNCLPDGKCDSIGHQSFGSQDEAFIHGAKQIIALEKL